VCFSSLVIPQPPIVRKGGCPENCSCINIGLPRGGMGRHAACTGWASQRYARRAKNSVRRSKAKHDVKAPSPPESRKLSTGLRVKRLSRGGRIRILNLWSSRPLGLKQLLALPLTLSTTTPWPGARVADPYPGIASRDFVVLYTASVTELHPLRLGRLGAP
jgi:hypothetical protein